MNISLHKCARTTPAIRAEIAASIERVRADLWSQPQTPTAQDMGLWLQRFYTNSAPLSDNFLADRQDHQGTL